MKKIVVLSMLFLLAISGSAFAAALAAGADSAEGLSIFGGVDAADAAATSSVLLGKLSKGVIFQHNSEVTGYAIITKHTSGTKLYGTAHDSTAIRFKDVGVGAATGESLSTAGVGAFADGGWTTM